MGDQYDRTLMRLSSTQDDKLEPVLGKLLPLVFDDLLTQTDAAARPKIVNILNHALTRTKGNAALQLPALGIIERWFSPKLATSGGAPFFRNLSLIFLDLALPRLTPAAQIELTLYVLKHFGELLPGADRAAMFLMALPGLGQIASEGHRKEKVDQCIDIIKEKSVEDMGMTVFFHAVTEFLLVPCSGAEAASVAGLPSASWPHWKARLKNKASADMVKMKIEVLKWLGSLAADPPASLVYIPSLVATVENYDAVSNIAETNVKRLDPELDLEKDDILLGKLLCAAMSSAPAGCEAATGSLRVEARHSVPSKLRLKVLMLLQRARIGTKTFAPYVVHLICQNLREGEQVQTQALQLAMVLAETVDRDILETTSSSVLEEVEKAFWPGGGYVTIGPATPLAFRCYGLFTKQLAEQPNGEGRALAVKAAPGMLTLLAANDRAAQDILEALSGLVACMRGASEAEWQGFVPLLDKLVMSSKAVVRREVLRWAIALFPATSPEGRYYALRLLRDPDPDIARAADNALAAGRREVPPFAGMCDFLAARALDQNTEFSVSSLDSKMQMLKATPPSLPPLSGVFQRRDLVRSLSFLLELAESEGLQQDVDVPAGRSPPAAKKPRLSNSATVEPGASIEAIIKFVALLDYLLLEIAEGSAAAVTEIVADGQSCVELGLRGLLLLTFLASGNSSILKVVMERTELVLFAQTCGTLFREGGATASRIRRLGARVAGSICKQFLQDSGDPTAKWLDFLSGELNSPIGCRRAGAVLAICEILRSRPDSADGVVLCQKTLRLLDPNLENDSDILTAVCDGLRRLSESQRLVWQAMEAGAIEGNTLTTRKLLLDRLYDLSKPVTTLGDIKESELGKTARDLAQASWRLFGQLAAWGGEESSECIDRLVAIGKHDLGEEAIAALGLALAGASTDPMAPCGQPASSQMESLIRRLLTMVEDPADAEPSSTPKVLDAEAKAKLKERDTERRCGTVWLAILLRRLIIRESISTWLNDLIEPLCRAFVRATADISMFTADVGLKALCYLYSAAPADSRTELMKTMFASFSNRTKVQNMFVGNPDTATRREKEKEKAASGPDSLKITAKERVDALKDLIFLSRELHHPPFFVALLDQPAAFIWTGEVFREALDLQSPCLPDDLKDHLCPVALRQKLYPPFFHPIPAVRQAVVALAANFYNCETPQQFERKFPQDWPQVAENIVTTLGAGRVTTREASIGASLLLFRGKAWPEVKDVFEDFWNITIKLMDDMEPTIEVAVKPLVRMVRNLTVRICDIKVTPRSQVEEALALVLPMLLKYSETYAHAQPLCFDVLRDLIKGAHGTSLMAAFVQDLIPPLMVSLSMMENSKLQYYQFHVDKTNEAAGKELESARISASRDSESSKLLRQLVPLLTSENAETLAPKTRDLMSRGVGANTRVGVCDFWGVVCAENPAAVPQSGRTATMILRSSSGALLDGSAPVRSAAASCFASLARRNSPDELTKVVFERLLTKDQEHRDDDAQRNSFRIALARALWEVCRRCGDGAIQPELKAAVAAKAFGLRYSDEAEVKTGWETLWNEMCPTISGGIERYHKGICQELAVAFDDAISRSEKITMSKAISALCAQLEKQLPRPDFSKDPSVISLHKAVLTAVQSLPIFDGLGTLVKGLADLAALVHRRKRGEDAGDSEAPTESSTGLTLILSFCSRGSLADRALATRSAIEVISASRLWSPLSDVAKLHHSVAEHIDELEREVEKEEREPGEPIPKRHRGKMQSPAEDLLSATLDYWTSTFEQCRKEVEDDGDLDPPEQEEFSDYMRATFVEFSSGSLTMRIGIIRFWKRLFSHLAKEKVAVLGLLTQQLWVEFAEVVQNASLDQRSERLRRPALDFAAALSKDLASGGGREALKQSIGAGVAAQASWVAPTVLPIESWMAKLDPHTAEQEAAAVKQLREIIQ